MRCDRRCHGRRAVAGLLAAGAALGLACSAAPPPRLGTPGPPGARTVGHQILWRARLEGGSGSGSFRLLLRQAAGGYAISAADALGRTLWVIEGSSDPGVTSPRPRLVDLHQRRVCEFPGDRIVIPALGLPPLPARALPDLLRQPFAPGAAPSGAAPDDLEWTFERDGNGLVVAAQGRLGSQSTVRVQRQGSAVEWSNSANEMRLTLTLVASERFAGPLRRREVPADFATGSCDALVLP